MNRCDIHNHTFFSNIRLIDALSSPKGLIDRAIDIGLKGVAVTDHECLSAHVQAKQYMDSIQEQHPDFKLMLGNEIYLVDERPCKEHYHFLLIAKNKKGHDMLNRLSSTAWYYMYSAKGMDRVDLLKSELEEVVLKNPGNLIRSTRCIGGELGKRVLALTAAEKKNDESEIRLQYNKIIEFILWNKKLFGSDFYLEIQPGISKEQIIVNNRIKSIAKAFEVKIIVTSDSHYLKPEDRIVHKNYLNSKEGDREVDAFYRDAYLHTNEDIIQKLALSDYSQEEVERIFNNTMEIYDKVEVYNFFHSQDIPTVEVKYYPKKDVRMPQYPNLERLYKSDDEQDRYWINECVTALYNKKLNDKKEYWEELEEEARVKTVIGQKLNTNMFRYPNTLKHYIDMMWDCGSIIGAGRGSSCAALNHYLLGITQLDPVQWNFPFFRYLNDERVELGDIDLDLAPSKKGQIIQNIKRERRHMFNDDMPQWVKDNLGCTLVATFGTEKTKSAILRRCRGYRSEEYPDGIEVDEAQYLSSLVPSTRGFVWDIKDVVYGNPEKDRTPVYPFISAVNNYPGLLDTIIAIGDVVKSRSSHASGVIFFDGDPFERMAFMRVPGGDGDIITQYDLHSAETLG